VCLPLLIFPCTVMSRSFLALADPGGPGKRAVKWLWCGGGLFLCTVTDFSAVEKARGVKFCMRVGILSGHILSPFGGQRSRSPRTKKRRLLLRSPTRLLYEWYAWLLLRCRRTSTFAGGRGVTSAAACSEARN